MSGNQFVTADAQFGNVKLLRPADNFVAIYQGQLSTIPILLAEDGLVLDPQAGKPGYSSYLARALPVPLGARVTLWLPSIEPSVKTPPGYSGNYLWIVGWRLRNLYDFRTSRVPYHLPKQTGGASSTLAGDTGARVVIPASQEDEIVSNGTGGDTVHPSSYAMESGSMGLPLYAVGQYLSLSQGVFDPGNPPASLTSIEARSTLWKQVELQALGDEMLLTVYRDRLSTGQTPYNTWDFVPGNTHADSVFGSFFDPTANTGVYVLVGSAP